MQLRRKKWAACPPDKARESTRNSRISYVTNDKEATRRPMFGLRPHSGNSGSYKVSIHANKIDHIGPKPSASGDNVFTELKRLIAKRSLTITVAVLDDEQIRVNVVPHACLADSKVNEQIKYSNKSEVASVPEDAIKALTTPISITGTAEEIDAKFPAILCEYVESHVQLQETLDRASSQIAEAVKAIDERNKSKANAKTVKKEEKSKNEEPKPKTDETLPLWWTDKTAAAPGTQPQPAPTVVVDAANPTSQTLLTQSSEVTQQ